jgi:autoinducer 2-degrading protein
VSGFVVIVDFLLVSGNSAVFRTLIDANAIASVRDEPGCRQFDVVEPEGEPDRILLYEIYDDAGAFDQHLHTPHFLEFDVRSKPLVVEKAVIRGALVCEG